MSDILLEEPVEAPPKSRLLLGVVSWYFIGIGILGLIAVASVGTGVLPEIIRSPLALGSVVVTRVGLILAGLQLRRRKRSAGIAALVMFALPLLGNLVTGTSPSLIAWLSALLGAGLVAAVWKDLRSD